jgi:hypothetical protein
MEPKYFSLADPIYHKSKLLVEFDLGTLCAQFGYVASI